MGAHCRKWGDTTQFSALWAHYIQISSYISCASLQRVQNNHIYINQSINQHRRTSCLVTGPSVTRTLYTPALRELQWTYRIQFKVEVFMHWVTAQCCLPSTLDTEQRSLRSASTRAAVILQTRSLLITYLLTLLILDDVRSRTSIVSMHDDFWFAQVSLFLAYVNSRSRSLYAIAIPSVVCLSVVCNVGASYSNGWNFWQFFFAIR